jgi:ABC-type dipeptide/oligopeptide/nickel transport system ATPase subunit
MVVATKKKEEVQVVVEKPAKKLSNLKAVVPEKVEKRLKLFVYGESGVGKTTAAIQFGNAYIIDAEHGSDFYSETIAKSNSVVFHSNIFSEVKQELENLLTEDHNFKTLIIDPITPLYQSIQEEWARRFETQLREKGNDKAAEMGDFGLRFWGKVKSDYKAIQRLILRLDMNVIVTAHQKDVYGTNSSKVGVAPDSMKGDSYFFDNVIRLEKRGKDRIAVVEKERAEIGKNKFPEEFVWSYENFRKFYGGEVLERKATAIRMATKDQVKRLQALIETVKIDADVVEKWLIKADADSFADFTEDQIVKCIGFVKNKLNNLGGVK